ncbi:hypothetical protein B296_00001099 [Ensete ventricosum]|uniref:Uncharacterized protein n=1 Tax=Ensete ventricosum TaxID=4639 RepID=A0A427BBH7_ENSVE|nr:hypothetical protein B296_00001099 [Ensete ventricosum]
MPRPGSLHSTMISIPLPDPDMYIDEVDHDAPVDPELVADLEKQPSVPTDVQSVAPGLSDYWDMCGVEAIQPTGWDDEVEPEPRNQDIKDGVGNSWNDSGGGHWDEAAAQNDPWSNGRNNWKEKRFRWSLGIHIVEIKVLIKQKIRSQERTTSYFPKFYSFLLSNTDADELANMGGT